MAQQMPETLTARFPKRLDGLCAVTVGVMLTGMGDDSARGMLAMKAAEATTLAEDEAGCVGFGMPAAAIQHGGAERVLPPGQMARAVIVFIREGERVPSTANDVPGWPNVPRSRHRPPALLVDRAISRGLRRANGPDDPVSYLRALPRSFDASRRALPQRGPGAWVSRWISHAVE